MKVRMQTSKSEVVSLNPLFAGRSINGRLINRDDGVKPRSRVTGSNDDTVKILENF